MKPRIVVIGSLNMDMIMNVPRMPVIGESLVGQSFITMPGGKGGNQAAAAAKLGADTVLAGRVGNDFFGAEIIKNLSAVGIDTGYIVKDPDNATGIGIVVIDPEGRNSAFVFTGANMGCQKGDVQRIKDIIAKADILLLQLEISLDVIACAVDIAVENRVRIILDPAPARTVPLELFQKADIVVPNQVEAQFFTGVKVSDKNTARKAAEKFGEMGARQVIVKLAEQGLFYRNDQGREYSLPGIKVNTVDTLAAGDAFAAALAVAWARDKDVRHAMSYANCVGALSTTKIGGQFSMPAAYEVEMFIKQRSICL